MKITTFTFFISYIVAFSTICYAETTILKQMDEQEESPTSPTTEALDTPADLLLQSDCFPPCREGFICHVGICVQRCNPPCGQGYTCNAEGNCIAILKPPPPLPSAAPSPYDKKIEQQRLERLEQRKIQLENIQHLRLTTEINWQLISQDLFEAASFSFTLGLYKNVSEIIGFSMRLGGGLGYANGHNSSLMGSFISEFSALFGPFKYFSVGPLIWFQHMNFKKDILYSEYNLNKLDFSNNGGIGADMIFLFGEKLNTGFTLRPKMSLFIEDYYCYIIEIGFTYHFLI